jgi:hypothetical protein
MPKVIYRGPVDRYEIDDLVLERDGEPVELSDEQLVRAQGSPSAQFELVEVGTSPSSRSGPSGSPPVQAPPAPPTGGSE